jgi:hypothetical protein
MAEKSKKEEEIIDGWGPMIKYFTTNDYGLIIILCLFTAIQVIQPTFYILYTYLQLLWTTSLEGYRYLVPSAAAGSAAGPACSPRSTAAPASAMAAGSPAP